LPAWFPSTARFKLLEIGCGAAAYIRSAALRNPELTALGVELDLLRHVRSFLKTGGRVLLTPVCQGRGSTAAVLDLWGAMTTGCGRLPEPNEMVTQIKEAGFTSVAAKSLIPGESFQAFVGTNPGG